MMITYETNKIISGAAMADVFTRSGIRRPVNELDRMERMIMHANFIITAWDGDKLVGVARSLTDFVYCCYLSDLAVDRDYQRQGIGREMVESTRKTLGDDVMILLLAAPEAMEYYPHIGFEKVENAFRIMRKR